MSAVSPTDPSFEDSPLDLTRVLTTLYLDLEQQIARADAKANLILAANSVLIAGSVNLAVAHLRAAEVLPRAWVLLLSLAPAVLLSAVALYYALSVAYPRQVHGASLMSGAPGPLFASPLIAAKSLDQYVAAFLGAGVQEIKRHALASVHAKASILQVKFRYVRYGIYATVGAFLGWFGFVIFIAAQG